MAVPLVDQTDVEQTYGMTLQDLTPELAEYLSFESTGGVLVAGIRKGSRAEQDGIEIGDIIVKLGSQNVENVASLRERLIDAASPIEARIFRKNHYLDMALHLK
jgi:S1-C subfamily serine protease